MNIRLVMRVAALGLTGAIVFGVLAGCATPGPATTAAPGKQTQNNLRYYGGPKSPMWPAAN